MNKGVPVDYWNPFAIWRGGICMQLQTYCFKKEVLYKEISVQHPIVDSYFEFDNSANEPIIVIPDGTSDIIFLYDQSRPEIYLGGTALRGRQRIFPIDGCAFGVRLQPGVFPDPLRDSLRNAVDSALLVTRQYPFEVMLEQMMAAKNFSARIRIFQNIFFPWIRSHVHPLTKFLITELQQKDKMEKIENIISETGYSHVHVNRVFKRDMGFSVKFYIDTLRIQQAIYHMKKDNIRNMQNFSEQLGFYDQSHFTKSFKAYTGYTPNQFYEVFKNSRRG
jgi:AraC-like DNA-binding protein